VLSFFLSIRLYRNTTCGVNTDEDIVICCSNPVCIASIVRYQLLTRMGYNKIRRYSGGIADWEQAGYPLEGNFCKLIQKYFLKS
jgi:3-mercaptopyruvate sulfurtransferase SseA